MRGLRISEMGATDFSSVLLLKAQGGATGMPIHKSTCQQRMHVGSSAENLAGRQHAIARRLTSRGRYAAAITRQAQPRLLQYHLRNALCCLSTYTPKMYCWTHGTMPSCPHAATQLCDRRYSKCRTVGRHRLCPKLATLAPVPCTSTGATQLCVAS